MKAFVILHLSFVILISSCTHISHPTAGSYTSFGGDTVGHSQDGSGFRFASNLNSPAFKAAIKEVRVMWSNYLIAKGLEYVTGKYYDHAGLEVSSAQAVKLEELKTANSVDLANIKLKELELAPTP